MKVTILGSGTAFFSLKRFSASYLLQTGENRILLDSGAGAIRRLLQANTHPNELDIIIYSHLHPDHTAELFPLLFGFRNGSLPRKKKLIIIAPPPFQEFYKNIALLYQDWLEPVYPLEFFYIKEPLCVSGITFSPFPVAHTAFSLAYRIEAEGKIFSYSGDTAFCPGLVKAMKGADLGICECSFPDTLPVPGHMTPQACRKLLKEAQPKKLILSHFYPEVEKTDILAIVNPEKDNRVLLAEDLMSVEF